MARQHSRCAAEGIPAAAPGAHIYASGGDTASQPPQTCLKMVACWPDLESFPRWHVRQSLMCSMGSASLRVYKGDTCMPKL